MPQRRLSHSKMHRAEQGGGVKELDVWLKIVGMHASAGAVYPQWEKEMV